MVRARNGSTQYVKLEQRLVLLAWLNSLFGYKSNHDLLTGMKERKLCSLWIEIDEDGFDLD